MLWHTVVLRWMAVLAAGCLSAVGQFSGLATPGDGSRVYFATPLRLKYTNQPSWGKLFEVGAAGLKLALSRDQVPPAPVSLPIGAVFTNAYNIVGSDLSPDGTVMAVNTSQSCYGGSSGTCLHQQLGTSTVTTPAGQHDYQGVLHLSPNGNWALSVGESNFAYPYAPLNLVNIQTGEYTNLKPDFKGSTGNLFTGAGRAVADDGTAVIAVGAGSVNIFTGTTTRVIDAPNPSEAVIDRAANLILFSICPKGRPDPSAQ